MLGPLLWACGSTSWRGHVAKQNRLPHCSGAKEREEEEMARSHYSLGRFAPVSCRPPTRPCSFTVPLAPSWGPWLPYCTWVFGHAPEPNYSKGHRGNIPSLERRGYRVAQKGKSWRRGWGFREASFPEVFSVPGAPWAGCGLLRHCHQPVCPCHFALWPVENRNSPTIFRTSILKTSMWHFWHFLKNFRYK